MNINFNRGDLVSFGEFLLSESRRERFANSESEASLPLQERLSKVHHADVENWLEERGKDNFLYTEYSGTLTCRDIVIEREFETLNVYPFIKSLYDRIDELEFKSLSLHFIFLSFVLFCLYTPSGQIAFLPLSTK